MKHRPPVREERSVHGGSRFIAHPVMLLLAWVAASAVGAQSLEPQVVATPAPGVQVRMVATRSGEIPAASSADFVDGGVWELRDSAGVQQIDAGELWGLWPEEKLMQRVRGMVTWEPPYLLLERNCTGTALTCRGKTVFRIGDGKARQIGYLPGDAVVTPATDASGPRFQATYARLEQRVAGLSHAGSPILVLILQNEGEHLVLDRTATCDVRINPKPLPDANRRESGELHFSKVAKAALVDKYCDRAESLAGTMATAERTLQARDYRALVAALALVRPFEVPAQ